MTNSNPSKTIDDINLSEWFTKRQLDYIPIHFHVANIRIKDEHLSWIQNKLKGRFSWSYALVTKTVAFEDPAELTMFVLKWG